METVNITTSDATGLQVSITGKALQISDGYHTFEELYEHRTTLYIALCHAMARNGMPVWRSELHSDGERLDGWFLLGIHQECGRQITYHLPIARWDDTSFAETLGRAPLFDGHTGADVLQRLRTL